MSKGEKLKFGGLNLVKSSDTTATGKPRYIFYVLNNQGKFVREVHANNLAAAAGAGLKYVYKKEFKDRTPVTFFLADKKSAAGRKTVKAIWHGNVTANLFPIFEPFIPIPTRKTRQTRSYTTGGTKNKTTAKRTTTTRAKNTGAKKTGGRTTAPRAKKTTAARTATRGKKS